jgi:hypothetical protein
MESDMAHKKTTADWLEMIKAGCNDQNLARILMRDLCDHGYPEEVQQVAILIEAIRIDQAYAVLRHSNPVRADG